MERDEFQSKVVELWTKSRVPLTEANLQQVTKVSGDDLSNRLDDLLGDGVLDLQVDATGNLTYSVVGTARSTEGPKTCEVFERKRALLEEAKRRILARRAGKSTPKKRPEQVVAYETPTPTKPAQAIVRTLKPLDTYEADRSEDKDEDEDEDNGSSIAGMVGKAALVASTAALVTLDKPLAMLDKPRRKGAKSLAASAGLSLLGPVGWLYAGSFREAVPAVLAQVALFAVVPSFMLAPFMILGALASSAVGAGYAWQFNRKKGRTTLFLPGASQKTDKKTDKKK